MSCYAPSWALAAQAIDAAGDPHLAKGVHLRLLPGALLGLPIFPLRVQRINLGKPGSSAIFRSDGLRFVDAKKNVLVPPFTMSADNPVTVHLPLPADGQCCWIEIEAGPVGVGLRADAMVAGESGLVTLSSAAAPRYQLAAARIDRVLLTGAARVSGASWVDARMLDRYNGADPWRLLSLPVAASTLYTPTTTAADDANARVKRGAPLREPMFKAPGAASPAAAPAIANPAQAEQQRVDAGAGKVKSWLATLVGPGSDLPWQRTRTSSTSPIGSNKPVQLEMGLIDSLWLASMDPGMSRWLGFGDVDELPVGQAGDVVAYVVRGFWQQGLGALADPDVLALLAAGRLDSVAALSAAKGFALANPPGAKAPFFDLFTVACATLGKPGISPAAPLIDGFEAKPFLPALPPAARREIVLKVSGLAPGPGAALARKGSGAWVSLNPVAAGVPIGLVVSRPLEGGVAGQGRISDRQAGAEAQTYRLAQADWFGRWSPWAEKTAVAADRPKPPVPVLQVGYAPPNANLWGQAGALSGLFTVVVPVPPNASLAPGSLPLSSLQLQVGAQTVTALVTSANANGDLVLTAPGPALLPCASATCSISAKWLAGNVPSPASLPIVRTVHDPRAPAPVALGAALAYASRPDATGKSRIDLRWQAVAPQQRFRVYYASETSLLAQLQAVNANLAGQISGLPTLPQRAQAFQDNRDKLDRSWFEPLTSDPLEKGAGSDMRLVHEVSGALATLGLYRVASVSAANVEGAFASTPLVAYAVPNTAPPAMPLLLVSLDPATGTATLQLRVPRGVVPAAFYRLRRTTGTPSDATRMRVLQEGVVAPAAAGAAMQQTVLQDNTLKPWRRTFWRAEVRGADLPGSDIKGAWSRPSAAVEAVLIPATPPLPVSQLSLKLDNALVSVGFKHDPAQLNGGSVGGFRFELHMRPPGERERFAAELSADAPAAAGGFNAQGQAWITLQQPAMPGTVFRVLVIDPLGRSSANNPTISVPQEN
jgi:hypothetical protein